MYICYGWMKLGINYLNTLAIWKLLKELYNSKKSAFCFKQCMLYKTYTSVKILIHSVMIS